MVAVVVVNIIEPMKRSLYSGTIEKTVGVFIGDFGSFRVTFLHF